MYSLIIHGRRSFIELQKKWGNLIVSMKLLQNVSSFANSFTAASAAAADVSLQDGGKGKSFAVSYLVDSLGLSPKLTESISGKVSLADKGNMDSILNLLRSYGFIDSQISSISTDSPRLLIADVEKSLGPKLKFLQFRGASTSELTEILSTVPKILGKNVVRSMGVYYNFVKDVLWDEKVLCKSLPKGNRKENKIRNISALRELGIPQKLFSMLISDSHTVCGKEKFEESLKKVIELGFDPTTSKKKSMSIKA